MMERTISRLFQDSELLVLFQKAALLDIIKDADLFLLKRFLMKGVMNLARDACLVLCLKERKPMQWHSCSWVFL